MKEYGRRFTEGCSSPRAAFSVRPEAPVKDDPGAAEGSGPVFYASFFIFFGEFGGREKFFSR